MTNPKEILYYIEMRLEGNVIPFDVERDAIKLIDIYASQQRTEGIKEGFEAAREVKSHNVDGDKERVDAILALWNNSLAEYATVEDYLSTKR